MSDPVVVDLFVEDRAHELFAGALVRRIARDENVEIRLQTRSARGGYARAPGEFDFYQKLIEKDAFATGSPDLVVVVIDGNCSTALKKRQEIEKATRPWLRNRIVAGCPNPHIERWFPADSSLKAFVDDLRRKLREIRGRESGDRDDDGRPTPPISRRMKRNADPGA